MSFNIFAVLIISMLQKNISGRQFEFFLIFFQQISFDISNCLIRTQELMCMKCWSLFSGKYKKKYQFFVSWIC